jgi:hypothetical protein
MSANIKASTDGTQAIIGVGGVDQMTVSNAGVVTANSFVGLNSSSVTATGSTTARTLANRFADVVNVKDFGAVGDGVADDTAAIQAAVAASGGKTIFFPTGTYIVNNNITITNSDIEFDNSKLQIQTGFTLNINCFIYCPNRQIFSGSGNVTGNILNSEIHVSWFGALPVTTSSQSNFIQKTINFAEQSTTVKRILFSEGGYRCDTKILLSNPTAAILLVGSSASSRLNTDGTWLDFSNSASGTTAIEFNASTVPPPPLPPSIRIYGGGIENINIYNSVNAIKGSGSAGIFLRSAQQVSVTNCNISGFDFCIDSDDGASPGAAVLFCNFTNMHLLRYSTSAIRVRAMIGCRFEKIVVEYGTAGYDNHLNILPSSSTGQSSDTCTFTNCIFIDAVNLAPNIVQIGGAKVPLDIIFDKCVFEETSGDAIQIAAFSAPDDTLISVSIINCWFNNFKRAVASIGAKANILISGNRMACGANGAGGVIHINSSPATSNSAYINIINNFITYNNATTFGIELFNLGAVLVQGNTFYAIIAASGNASIVVNAGVNNARLINNHSKTTWGTVDGIQDNGTSTVRQFNIKTTT